MGEDFETTLNSTQSLLWLYAQEPGVLRVPGVVPGIATGQLHARLVPKPLYYFSGPC